MNRAIYAIDFTESQLPSIANRFDSKSADSDIVGVRVPLPAPHLVTRTYALADFDYALPPELVAQVPAAERGGSRLLHVDGAHLHDRAFADLPRLLRQGDLVVFNDTRVLNARVHATKASGGKAELLIERIVGPATAWAQVRASHAPKPGATLQLPGSARATVREREDRFFLLEFVGTGPLVDWLDQHGEVPLPPYIGRSEGGADAADKTRYQTVYARAPGAVAAPTAGLHFDAAMLAALADAGVATAWVTLHVGAGTFLPVQTEDLALHRMHDGVVRAAAGHDRCDRGCARARRPRRGRGHHEPARARIRGARAGRSARRRCRNVPLHHARLSLPRGGPTRHQLPPAALHAADARQRFRGLRRDPGRLRARDRRPVPLLQLRRRHAAGTRRRRLE